MKTTGEGRGNGKGTRKTQYKTGVYGIVTIDGITYPLCKKGHPITPENQIVCPKPNGRGKFAGCKKCKLAYGRDNQRRIKLLLSYHMTLEDYDNLMKQQNGKCAICKTDRPTGKGKILQVDHDRELERSTGEIKIRGLLCTQCNVGIGMFKDSIELLKLAEEYLNGYDKNK